MMWTIFMTVVISAVVMSGCSPDKKEEVEDSGESSKNGACPLLSSWVQVDAGKFYSCAVSSEGCVECWGNEELYGMPGYYGHNNWTYEDDGTVVPDEKMQKVSVSDGYPMVLDNAQSCGITEEGIVCWGRNVEGESEPQKDEWIDVGTKYNISCGVSASYELSCWGEEYYGYSTLMQEYELKRIEMSWGGICGLSLTGNIHCVLMPSFVELTEYVFVDLCVGDIHVCGLTEEGSVECNSGYGDWSYPSDVEDPFIGIDCSNSSSEEDVCVVHSSGRLSCFSSDALLSSPPEGHHYTQVSVGVYHACAVTQAGEVVCWGRDEWGLLDTP